MARDESSGGLGSLLMKGITGVVSIAATAVVSTTVQRYMSPVANSADSTGTPPAIAPTPAQPIQSEAVPPSPIDPAAAPVVVPTEPLPDLQPDTQPIDAAVQVAPEADPSAPQATPADPSGNPVVEQAGSPVDSLRDKLNRVIRDKWNRN